VFVVKTKTEGYITRIEREKIIEWREDTVRAKEKRELDNEWRKRLGKKIEKQNKNIITKGSIGLRPNYLGFKIWNEHIRFSSTFINAPALSNSPQ